MVFERTYTFTGRDGATRGGTLRVGGFHEAPNGDCHVELSITGLLPSDWSTTVNGVDAIQAMTLALGIAAAKLESEVERERGQLSWLGHAEHGLPMGLGRSRTPAARP
ncbi:MAG: hypothetical protein U0234_01235 [Sandaracinus sp.]